MIMSKKELLMKISQLITSKDKIFNISFEYFILSLNEWQYHYDNAKNKLDYKKVAYLIKRRDMILKYAIVRDFVKNE